MRTIKPPIMTYRNNVRELSIFLGGSIEMGTAENWQAKIEDAMQDRNVLLLNPRRDDWNSNWEQKITNDHFYGQVEWETAALEYADMIVMYFDPYTKSPISLLELGLFATSGKMLVCCPEGFWRKGNVDFICEKYGIDTYETLDELIDALKIMTLDS